MSHLSHTPTVKKLSQCDAYSIDKGPSVTCGSILAPMHPRKCMHLPPTLLNPALVLTRCEAPRSSEGHMIITNQHRWVSE